MCPVVKNQCTHFRVYFSTALRKYSSLPKYYRGRLGIWGRTEDELELIAHGPTSRTVSRHARPPRSTRNEIYCHGRLLDAVQMASVFHDSKTFVDLKMKYSPNETLQRFDEFAKNHQVTDRDSLMTWVNQTFDPAGSEFEKWDPSDWQQNPKFLNKIADLELREWAYQLNGLWKELGRKMKAEVEKNQELYSIIWVKHPVIVPGGRFREFYYWDSYWIMKGLLLSEMYQTTKGMLENFLDMVDKFGFVPNGGRVYYTQRSQPPFLIPMVKLYFDATGDQLFIEDRIETMEKEFNYWMEHHLVNVTKAGKYYKLAVYGDKSSGPRPESYREDVENARIFPTDVEKESHYSELKAAAESGWDFSSRWFIANATNKGNLTNLKTHYIVPVDLNALIYGNAITLSQFYKMLNNNDKSNHYINVANEWKKAVTDVLWHDDVGAWLDYDVLNGVRRDYFYPSNLVPLWTECYDPAKKDHVSRKVMNYLKINNIMKNPGGVPTSLEQTGEQWDFPNAWPPLQHMLIEGLNKTDNSHGKQLAKELATIWIKSNFKAFNDTGHMYEKYDATTFGGHGGGGEYEIQLGFGWSNGAIMDLLNMYGQDVLLAERPSNFDLHTSDISAAASVTILGQIVTGLLALLVSVTAGFIGIAIYKKRNSTSASLKNKLLDRSQYTELKNLPKEAGDFR